MITKIVYDNVSNQLSVPSEMLPVGQDKPCAGHLTGTVLENLCEICGKVCYDSLSNPKGRNSRDYHFHIKEVGHFSIWEHSPLTFQIDCSTTDVFIGRPGVEVNHCPKDHNYIRVSINFRAIWEWDLYIKFISYESKKVGDWLKNEAHKVAPLIFSDPVQVDQDFLDRYQLNPSIVPPQLDQEIWVSFFLSGISRNCTHELVRHRYGTAVSQRSTRYVKESNANWIQHPLYDEYIKSHPEDSLIKLKDELMDMGQMMYDLEASRLQSWLISKGIDKGTALKQSRGSARSNLGTCLETELIFSANLKNWKHILNLRSNSHSDGEIRKMTNMVYLALKDKFPSRFTDYRTQDCKDGIGFEVLPQAKKE